ncbi:MAG: MBL fold metallo-hydrolase [Halohasta sp.]
MRLTFLGTGSAMPSPTRLQSSLLVDHEGHTLLVDCGSGATHRLAQTDRGYDDVDAVVLTHTHLDHVADLSTLVKARWLDGIDALDVYGPPGTADTVERLLAVDSLNQRADVRVRELEDIGSGTGRVEIGPHRLTYTETTHSARCLAYRFGDRLAISGDTAPDDAVFALADGVDVLVHECSFPDGTETEGHTTPTALADGLGEISVDAVYLTHLFPAAEARADEIESAVAAGTDANVTVPDDLETIGLD